MLSISFIVLSIVVLSGKHSPVTSPEPSRPFPCWKNKSTNFYVSDPREKLNTVEGIKGISGTGSIRQLRVSDGLTYPSIIDHRWRAY